MNKALDGIKRKLSDIIEEGKEQLKKSYTDAVKDIDDTIVSIVAKVSAPLQKEVAPNTHKWETYLQGMKHTRF